MMKSLRTSPHQSLLIPDLSSSPLHPLSFYLLLSDAVQISPWLYQEQDFEGSREVWPHSSETRPTKLASSRSNYGVRGIVAVPRF
ncbi:hypothetical protein FCM35_KLT08236 [Carex littledalei]|uniref:Uncharacterized protein n=1 Tax=Carex littledalei TaxID=544730 RepID=A0A833V6H1_9POAL|nr:hypothetical protein FCM35_KLT08236 [Carex littledalei]